MIYMVIGKIFSHDYVENLALKKNYLFKQLALYIDGILEFTWKLISYFL